MEKKRILYIMHVPWGWIKQRPHFFAEYLADDYEVDVVFKRPWKVKKKDLLNKNLKSNINIRSYFLLPFNKLPLLRKLKFLEIINLILLKVQLGDLNKYDYVWYTNLTVYSRFKRLISSRAKVLYDCMDDDFEFGNLSLSARSVLLKEETEILKKADKVYCSAHYLKNKVISRTGIDREILIVNNAVALPNADVSLVSQDINSVVKKLESLSNVFMYIGAISEWFDFESILYSLEQNKTMNFVLFGPANITLPKHPRVHHFGTVDRSVIFLLMTKAMALVMPFKLNELIRSVNPVKLYEYIYASKPVIATQYSETEKFSDFVYLYNDKFQFNSLVTNIISRKISCKNSEKENSLFTRSNTWGQRYNDIKKSLDDN